MRVVRLVVALVVVFALLGAAPSGDAVSLDALLLIGPPGTLKDGYPTNTPDVAALRGLLRAKKFDELTRQIEGLQKAYEADWHREWWMARAADAFSIDDPRLEPLLNEYVQADPRSFAPPLLRAAYRRERGWRARGVRIIKDTSKQQLSEMDKWHRDARLDFTLALERRPTLLVAYRYMVSLQDRLGPSRRTTLNASLKLCPQCVSVRRKYFNFLQPKWGGSFEETAQEAKAAQAWLKDNPRLARFNFAADWARCEAFKDQVTPKERDQSCRRLAKSEDDTYTEAWFEHHERRGGFPDDALAVLDAALAANPGSGWLHATRARIRVRQGDWAGARDDLRRALEIEPFEEDTAVAVREVTTTFTDEARRTKQQGVDEIAAQFEKEAAALLELSRNPP